MGKRIISKCGKRYEKEQSESKKKTFGYSIKENEKDTDIEKTKKEQKKC